MKERKQNRWLMGLVVRPQSQTKTRNQSLVLLKTSFYTSRKPGALFQFHLYFLVKKKKHTESFRWASLTLYVAIRPHPDTVTCPTRARLILPQILYPPAWHSQPFPSSLSKLQSYPRTLLSLTCKGVQFMNPNKPIF